MNSPGYLQKIFLLFTPFLIAGQLQAQINIRGTIYDRSLRIALQGVTVSSSSGKNVTTDAKGSYQIALFLSDSIFFPISINALPLTRLSRSNTRNSSI